MIFGLQFCVLGCAQEKQLSPNNAEVRDAISEATRLPKVAQDFLKEQLARRDGSGWYSTFPSRFFYGGRLSYMIAMDMILKNQTLKQMQEFSLIPPPSGGYTLGKIYLKKWNLFSGDRIFDIKYSTKGSVTTGTFRFFVPEACAGKAEFTLKPVDGKFIITEIRFPENKFRIYYDGKTKSLGKSLKKSSAKPFLIYRSDFYKKYQAYYFDAMNE